MLRTYEYYFYCYIYYLVFTIRIIMRIGTLWMLTGFFFKSERKKLKTSFIFAATSTVFTTEMATCTLGVALSSNVSDLALAYTLQRAVPWIMCVIMDNTWAAVWRPASLLPPLKATACIQVGLSARHNWILTCAPTVNSVLSRGPFENALSRGFYTLSYLNGSVWLSGPLVLSGAAAG